MKVNSTLIKAIIPYLGSKELIVIEIPEKFLQLENPNRVNMISFMKQRRLELENLMGGYA